MSYTPSIWIDGRDANLFGVVAPLERATRWPGGCWDASFTITLDPGRFPRALRRNARVDWYLDGLLVHAGYVSGVGTGQTRQIDVRGLGMLATYADALDADGNPTADPQTAVEQAIARGALPGWATDYLDTGDWPDPVTSSDTTIAINKVADVLDDATLAASGTAGHPIRWSVGADGQLRFAADPAVPSLRISAINDTQQGTADDDFACTVHGLYVSEVNGDGTAVGWATVTYQDDDALAEFGPAEEPLDLTGLGLLTEGQAQALTDGRGIERAPRQQLTSQIEVSRVALTTMNDIAPYLGRTFAGQMARVDGVVDARGPSSWASFQDVVVYEDRHYGAEERLQLTPAGMAARSYVDLEEKLAGLDRRGRPIKMAG